MAVRSTKPIYLVVATTLSPSSGIGYNGSLPWKRIKKDMDFFKAVTTATSPPVPDGVLQHGKALNAVIMGKKTWDSVPRPYKPLSDRINVVVSRTGHRDLAREIEEQLNTGQKESDRPWKTVNDDKVSILKVKHAEGLDDHLTDDVAAHPIMTCQSISAALDYLENRRKGREINPLRNVFCIGGQQIYELFLNDNQLRPRCKILQTEIRKFDGPDFPIDTYFPIGLSETQSSHVQELPREEVTSELNVDLPQGDAEWTRAAATDLEGKTCRVELRVRSWQVVAS